MTHIHAEHVRLPGEAHDVRTTAWRCDSCSLVHVAVSLLMIPDEDAEDLVGHSVEPITLTFDMTEDVARKLIDQVGVELLRPAPGYDGGISLPLFDTWEVPG